MLYAAKYLSETKAKIFSDVNKWKNQSPECLHYRKSSLRKFSELYTNDLCTFPVCIFFAFNCLRFLKKNKNNLHLLYYDCGQLSSLYSLAP